MKPVHVLSEKDVTGNGMLMLVAQVLLPIFTVRGNVRAARQIAATSMDCPPCVRIIPVAVTSSKELYRM